MAAWEKSYGFAGDFLGIVVVIFLAERTKTYVAVFGGSWMDPLCPERG
jgi:hypothetical protein